MTQKRKYEKKTGRLIHTIDVLKVIRFELILEDNETECCVYFSMLRTKGKLKGQYTPRLRDYWFPYRKDDDAAIQQFKKFVTAYHETWEQRLGKKKKAKIA
jgi:hypothetical protein